MTSTSNLNQTEITLNTASPSGPWSQRNLATGSQILEDLRKAKANLKIAQQAEKQALQAFKDAKANGDLDEHFDDLAEQYCAPGIVVTITEGTRFSEKGYSTNLQVQMKAERDNGIAKPTKYETIRVKLGED